MALSPDSVTKLYDNLDVRNRIADIVGFLAAHGLEDSHLSLYSTYSTSRFLCSILPEILKRKTLHAEIVISRDKPHILFEVLKRFQLPDSPNELVKVDWEHHSGRDRSSLVTNPESPETSVAYEPNITVNIWITWCGPLKRCLTSQGWFEEASCFVYPGGWNCRSMIANGIEGLSSIKVADANGKMIQTFSAKENASLVKVLSSKFAAKRAAAGKHVKSKNQPSALFTLEREDFRTAKSYLQDRILYMLEKENLCPLKGKWEVEKSKIGETTQLMFSLTNFTMLNYKGKVIDKRWKQMDFICVTEKLTGELRNCLDSMFQGLRGELWSHELVELAESKGGEKEEGFEKAQVKEKIVVKKNDHCGIF